MSSEQSPSTGISSSPRHHIRRGISHTNPSDGEITCGNAMLTPCSATELVTSSATTILRAREDKHQQSSIFCGQKAGEKRATPVPARTGRRGTRIEWAGGVFLFETMGPSPAQPSPAQSNAHGPDWQSSPGAPAHSPDWQSARCLPWADWTAVDWIVQSKIGC